VSLEGRRFWVLAQAPLSRRLLVAQKFWLSVAFSATITVVLTAISGWRLHLHALPFAYSLFTVVIASFALSGLAVGLGSLYPNLTEDSPARIVSGLGGTLTFILSAVYVVLAAGGETVVLNWHRHRRELRGSESLPLDRVAVVVACTLAITALTTLLLSRWAPRAWRTSRYDPSWRFSRCRPTRSSARPLARPRTPRGG